MLRPLDLAKSLHDIYLADGVFPQCLGEKLTLDAAYDAQFGLLDLRLAGSEELAGWKVGLTSRAMQQQQGVDEPCLGHLLRSGHVPSQTVFEFDRLKSPGFENELCLRLDHDLGQEPTFDEVVDAIGAVAPALEIIEKRSHFGLNFSLAVAGNAQQHAYVTGDFIPFDGSLNLAEVIVTVEVNGVVAEQASGTEVLGTPVHSVMWLAKALARRGQSIKQGSLIMSGSFTRQYALAEGDRVRASFYGVGSVSAEFK
jgi:2-keto-4-pentenoate hydratase